MSDTEPGSKALAQDGQDSDQVLDFVQQGLLPLPLKSILVARLVCKYWQTHIGCLIPALTLPFEVWAQGAASVTAALVASHPNPYADGSSSSEEDDEDVEEEEEKGDEGVTLMSRGAPPSPAAVATSMRLLGQLPQLKSLLISGSMSPAAWRLVGPAVTSSSSHDLQQRLLQLHLVGLDLPDPTQLEQVMAALTSLTLLYMHVSMKSPALQAAHLEAVSCATQLQHLALWVYQATSRCLVDPLLQLTNLQHLDLTYKGIFNDQRPALSDPASLSQLQPLTSLCSGGLASPLLPQPSLTCLQCLSITGLTKRLHHSAVSSIAACSSLRQLRLEAGKRGVAAVAAEHLQLLSPLQHLTSLFVAVSKGSLPSQKSSQQLLTLSAMGEGLRSLALTADHRLSVDTPLLVGLAQQWPKLEALRLNKFAPTEGFSGFGGLTGLTALSLKPGQGTGKLLHGLLEGLTPLRALQRLHIDLNTSLRLDQVEAVAEACADRLRHLSLNMRGSSIGSKAVVAIAQLRELTSLQLLNTLAATLMGPPAIAALRSMTALRWLSVQAPEDAGSQTPGEDWL
eukprot:gene11030-11185_t